MNPVISSEFICTIENEYSFTLPEDYFRFITEIGDEGAFVLVADSFDEFYQNWLDGLEENELKQKIDNRRKIAEKMKHIF